MNSTITDPYILVKPSTKMRNVVKQLDIKVEMPLRIKSLIGKQECKDTSPKINMHEFHTTSQDYALISTLLDKEEEINPDILPTDVKTFSPKDSNEKFLHLEDIIWLNKQLEKQRENGKSVYLHELLQSSAVFVPENEKIERNPELEKRCTFLKTQQDNKRYKSMTKNVDNIRLREPEESIAYQIKQINKQLIAVSQFIISVLAGFAFGFIGVELMVGNLDFGFRLLLGIMCALTIALAELYFLAKQLAE